MFSHNDVKEPIFSEFRITKIIHHVFKSHEYYTKYTTHE